MVSKIKQAYHATRFCIHLTFQEFPHGWRLDYGFGDQTTDVRGGGGKPDIRSALRRSEGSNTSSFVHLSGSGTNPNVDAADISCCGMFGFFGGDAADISLDSNSNKSPAIERNTTQDLQNGKAIYPAVESDREWDLLDPTTRQVIILDAMRSHQAKFETHQIFTVHDVVVLCDRTCVGAHWDIVFDDLVLLLQRRSVVLVPATQGKVFLGLFWRVA